MRSARVSVTLCSVTVSNRNPRPLTPLQQDILESVWEHGPLTADQLRERLATKHRLKDSSIRTLLRRLESQGYLRHSVEGKSYLYEAAESPASAAARNGAEPDPSLLGGVGREVSLVGMVDEKVLSAAQIRQLAKRVEWGQERGERQMTWWLEILFQASVRVTLVAAVVWVAAPSCACALQFPAAYGVARRPVCDVLDAGVALSGSASRDAGRARLGPGHRPRHAQSPERARPGRDAAPRGSQERERPPPSARAAHAAVALGFRVVCNRRGWDGLPVDGGMAGLCVRW